MDSVSQNLALVAAVPDIHHRSGGLSASNLRRVLDAIEAQEGQCVPVQHLAASIPMSPFHFTRAFKVSTGLPPYRFMRVRRIERAKELLAHGATPIAQVARDMGFKTPSHFASVFREIVGMSPRQYRLEARR